MAKTLNAIYHQYMNSEEHAAQDQSIYDGSQEEALAAPPKGIDPSEYENIVSTVMSNAHMQGFLDGFKHASKIWADCLGKE